MTYLLCHGFGFTNEYWKNLIPLLDDDFEFFDENFRFDSEKNYIGIGHSLGFLKLNNSGIKFKALIGLQGFLNFCGEKVQRNKLLRKNLDRMIGAFKKTPELSLKFFYKLCGYDGATPKNISPKNLITDLEIMKLSFNHCGVPTLIIGSEDDKVVEKNILEANFRNKTSVQLKFVNGVNHTLGYAKATETFKMIRNFLAEIG